MGIWSWDIIGCDANLELAMDLLTTAGVGPRDYAERRKTFKVIVSSHPSLSASGKKVWCGRHTPEEYAEFHECLSASSDKHTALDKHFPTLVKFANSVQTVFDIGGGAGDGDTPVGHAFQVLGLILMQAGVLPLEVADILTSMPICAASDPGSDNERASHEERFKAAICEYKDAHSIQHNVFMYTRVHDTASSGEAREGQPAHISVMLQPFPVFSGLAIKYRPRSWAEQMFACDDMDVPATIVKEPFGIRASHHGRAQLRKVEQGDAAMEAVAAQGKVDRAAMNAAYTRDPDKVHPEASNVGKRVRLQGLVKRPECNGLVGTIAAFNHGSDRFAVEVDKIGRMALKKENLDFF